MNITRNMSSKFYPDFIPIYGYMVSGVRCQEWDKQNLKPEHLTFERLQKEIAAPRPTRNLPQPIKLLQFF